MASPGPVDPASVAMQEFISLRAEIDTRTASQNGVINITVVAVGAIGGFAFGSNNVNPLVLLILVPLVVATGLQWLDHAHSIYRIGKYIKRELWPRVRGTLGTRVDSYEYFVLRDRSRWRERSVLVIPFLILFIGPGAVGLVYVAIRASNALTWVAWSAEVFVMLYFISMWVSFLREALRSDVVAARDST